MSARRILAPRILAPLSLIIAATTWGLIWYPYRLLEEAGVSGSLASMLTYLVALFVLLISVGTSPLRQAGQYRGLILIALVAGWTNLAYVLAVIQGEIMRVMLLFYLAPFWTLAFSRLLLGERPNAFGYLVMALSLAGAVIMLGGNDRLPLPSNSAEWLGLSAGICFALSNVMARQLRDIPTEARSLWIFAGVMFVALGPLSFEADVMQTVEHLTLEHWGLIVLVGLGLVIATQSVQYGLANTPANRAIVILLVELVVAAFASWWLVNETMALREWIGGGMIIAASLFSGKVSDKAGEGDAEHS